MNAATARHLPTPHLATALLAALALSGATGRALAVEPTSDAPKLRESTAELFRTARLSALCAKVGPKDKWKVISGQKIPARCAVGSWPLLPSVRLCRPMTTHKDIDAFLAEDCSGKVKDKTWFLGMFGSVIYTVTGEKVQGGFRYFTCEPAPLLDALERQDIKAMLDLPFALDEDGEVDTSSLLISVHYTESGSMVAMQVSEYQDHNPVPISPVTFLEGPAAKSLIADVKALDQSN